MQPDFFKQIVESGKEGTSLEFKESQAWETIRNKITRCVLAMTNTREGGYLIVGIEDAGNLAGMQAAHLGTFHEEEVRDYVSNFADPRADFDMHQVNYDGRDFLVFVVREFAPVPVICKRDSGTDLRKGALYVRSRNGRPQSNEINDSAHMRELIDLAVDKSQENLVARGWQHRAEVDVEERFREERADLNL